MMRFDWSQRSERPRIGLAIASVVLVLLSIHEVGHWILAVVLKIRVRRIIIGRCMCRRKEWLRLCGIPIYIGFPPFGGRVDVFGEMRACSSIHPDKRGLAVHCKRSYQQLMVASGGILVNALIGAGLLTWALIAAKSDAARSDSGGQLKAYVSNIGSSLQLLAAYLLEEVLCLPIKLEHESVIQITYRLAVAWNKMSWRSMPWLAAYWTFVQLLSNLVPISLNDGWHIWRNLRQLLGEPQLTDDKWIKARSAAKSAKAKCAILVAAFFSHAVIGGIFLFVVLPDPH
ncbi:site-2 protease family protein [Dongia soli]|uniref:Site-2 protease family protein n=1 Tax=Dongia soli TaxID=600628 RepID=A0ABU5EGE0_9PROT|nr:site-2 protease family protein [Dongia soli]MDY0885421.1 site-2 protease family protein [Dongia soli]